MLTDTIKPELNCCGFIIQQYAVQMESESIKASPPALFKTIHLIRSIIRDSNAKEVNSLTNP